MIKSKYSDPAIDGRGFVNHIHHVDKDMGVYPGTTDPLIEAYKIEMIQNLQATSGTGGKPRNLALFRKAVAPGTEPSAGVWHLIKMWREGEVTKGADYDEASAAGSVDILPDGTVHIVMSFGKKNAAGAFAYQPWEAAVKRETFAPPVERLPTDSSGSSTDPRYDALVSQLGALGQQLDALSRRPLVAPAQGGPEGGEVVLEGAPGHPSWHIDTVEGQLRIFSEGKGALVINASGVWVGDGAGGLRKL